MPNNEPNGTESNEPEIYPCPVCGHSKPIDEMTDDPSGEYDGICSACSSDYVTCICCENMFHTERMKHPCDGESWCEDCFDNHWYYCEHCNEPVHEEEARSPPVGFDGIYCESCYSDVFGECDGCGRSVYGDDLRYDSEDDEYYCEDCFEGNPRRSGNRYEGGNQVWQLKNIIPPSELRHIDAIGIEIECISPNPVPELDSKFPDIIGYFSATYDGSVSSGLEFVSCPIPLATFNEFIVDCIPFFKTLSVDKSCGFHTHFNILPYLNFDNAQFRDVGKMMKKVLLGFWRLENFLYKTQPTNRRGSNYCARIGECTDVGTTPEELIDMPPSKVPSLYYKRKIVRKSHIPRDKYENARHCWINVHSIILHGTIEIRLHTGTTNARKMRLWVNAMHKIFKWIVTHRLPQVAELNPRMLPDIISKKEMAYLNERIAKFNPKIRNSIKVYPEEMAMEIEGGESIDVMTNCTKEDLETRPQNIPEDVLISMDSKEMLDKMLDCDEELFTNEKVIEKMNGGERRNGADRQLRYVTRFIEDEEVR